MIYKNVEKKDSNKCMIDIDLGICILFYEKLDQTIECICSFLPSGKNIYILNNGSSSSARQSLGSFCDNYKHIKIYDADSNKGVSGGRNYLLSHTNEDWLLFVDSDIVVKSADWLQKFAQYVYSYNNIEVFIPKLFNNHENNYSSYRSIRIVGNKAFHDVGIIDDLTNNFPGGASFINRRLFDRLGLYDEKMFVGFEDFELSIRGIVSGNPVKALLIRNIEFVHDHRPVKNIEDNKSVLLRYDENLLHTSYNRIVEKHGLILDSNWKNWAANQVERIVNKHDSFFEKYLKILLPNRIRVILKRIHIY